MKWVRWFATALVCAILTSNVLAQEPLAAGSPDPDQHDPADPLLREMLAWDEFAQARLQMTGSCDRRIARRQWRNMRLRYRHREQRIFSHVRERFGDRVIHGHDIILLARCSRTTNGSFPGGIDEYRRALVAYEQHLGIDARSAAQN